MSTITRRGPRQWQARVRKKGTSACETFETRQEAERWAREVEAAIQDGTWRGRLEAERVTLAEAMDRYRREVLPGKKSRSSVESQIERLKAHSLASLPLASITGMELARYRDERLKEVGPQSVIHDLSLFSRLFNTAIREWGIVLPAGNPVQHVRKPSKPAGRDRRLLPGEEEALLEAARAYGEIPIEAIIVLALETAARRGEISAMRWEHVDLRSRIWRIPDSKTGDPRRVPLSTRARDALSALPRRLDGEVWGCRADSITQAFTRVARAARKDCEERETNPDPRFLMDLRFHDLRHEATSRLFEKGLSVVQVRAITGHKTLQMLARYTHPRAEDLLEMLG